MSAHGARVNTWNVRRKPDGHRLIAKAIQTKAEIPYSDMPAPGAPGHVTILAIRHDETRDDAARLSDCSRRWFVVRLLLVRQVTLPDSYHSDFTKEDGTSYVKLTPPTERIKVATSFGDFEIELNAHHQLSIIRMKVEAHEPLEARDKVYDASAAFLDHLSFLANVSVLTGLMTIEDNKSGDHR